MNTLKDRYLKQAQQTGVNDSPDAFRVTWESPSNIALVKYWGKKNGQIPENPSISMTLSHSRSKVSINGTRVQEADAGVTFFFEGEPAPEFGQKMTGFLGHVKPFFPFLSKYSLVIDSLNTFPHSAGIASSASSMSALALCLVSIENYLLGKQMDEPARQKSSYFARLGSGSACRSVFPGYAVWGRMSGLKESSDEFAVPLNDRIAVEFREMRDAILIVSSARKAVSSTVGHKLMQRHPFAGSRYQQARDHAGELIRSITVSPDWDQFIAITEAEALTLHALIMSSEGGGLLIKPETLTMMEKIRAFRKDTSLPVCFTIDAGPNIHLLYPGHASEPVRRFIESELRSLCEEGKWIEDRLGRGPVLINETYERTG